MRSESDEADPSDCKRDHEVCASIIQEQCLVGRAAAKEIASLILKALGSQTALTSDEQTPLSEGKGMTKVRPYRLELLIGVRTIPGKTDAPEDAVRILDCSCPNPLNVWPAGLRRSEDCLLAEGGDLVDPAPSRPPFAFGGQGRRQGGG